MRAVRCGHRRTHLQSTDLRDRSQLSVSISTSVALHATRAAKLYDQHPGASQEREVSWGERQRGPRMAMFRRFDSLLSLRSDAQGSQIVEFAVALPLLVVFVVGIFDFGNAFSLKHK